MRALELSATWAPRPGRLTTAQERAHKAAGPDAWRDPRLTWVERPDPEPGRGDVVIAVGVCGICGSDTHCIETDPAGYLRFSGPMRLPCVLGHEVAGVVVEVGEDVQALRPGQLVTTEGMLRCGRCEPCRRGRPNQCVHLEMLGFSAPGGMAELVRVGQESVWDLTPLADALGSVPRALEWGSMVEPMACVYNAVWVEAGGMAPGSFVAVHGCGPIGLGAIALCRAAGAARIVAFDTEAERVALARALGADAAFTVGPGGDAEGSAAEAVRQLTGGYGADLHVEAAGAGTSTLPQIEASLAPGATVIYLGRTGERIPLAMDALVSGAARVVGSRGHAGGGCFPNLLRMMAAGVLDPSPMVTARIPLADADAALRRSTARADGKILLTAR